jgi:transcription-repair coupling factor (superfamily II helicase)
VASGIGGSAVNLAAGHVLRTTKRPVVIIVAHIDDADEALDELSSVPAFTLPALEALPGETGVSTELFAERLAAIRAVTNLAQPSVIIAPIAALMQLVPPPAQLEHLTRTLKTGQDIKLPVLTNWLVGAGYKRVEAIEEVGDFALRGGILDIFPPGGTNARTDRDTSLGTPVRLDFFGDTLDRITEIDIESMGSDRSVKAVDLFAADTSKAIADGAGINFLELVPKDATILLAETLEIVEQGRGYFERVLDSRGVVGPPAVLRIVENRFRCVVELNQFSAGATSTEKRIDMGGEALPSFSKDAAQAVTELVALSREPENCSVVVCCQNQGELDRLSELLAGTPVAHEQAEAPISSTIAYLHRGFIWQRDEHRRTAFVPYHEILNRFTVRRRTGRIKSGRAMDTFLDFQAGDYVVHVDHGIARFAGLTVMKPREVPAFQKAFAAKREIEPEEYLTLEFAGQSKLHVPAMQIDKVQKYVGGFAGKPPLSTLGGVKWKNQKERVAESVKDLAGELLRVRAARDHMPGIAYPADTTWQQEFEAEFPYEETQDQLAALSEIKRDMTRARPMDRLICGDVGFGKTELAIRAAFKACEFGRQVAVLVPTTVLAEQHERTFKGRFAGYPFRVESVSRFKTDKEAKDILDDLKKGRVDLIIGTHRLLSKDVIFSDLGLVIVDEEQRFGVEHKEALLRLRLTVDVLTLSATPIPRTLHMAMLGIRDISSLTTAPLDRRAIVTEVFPYNDRRIQQAISRELAREGQIYFVHNRVHDIISVADNVRKLCPPGTRVIYGHGQMPPHELEEVMLKFMRRQADVLVATTIIEAGIDIASANTMIINDADRFGLADLHQLRGRVGRSKHRAYCYLLLDPEKSVKEVAQKRLKAIEQFSMLGAGFKIAMRDLEIRGAGNILGPEQSGHIAAVGYEMYCHLLEKSVDELKNEKKPDPPSSTALEIGVSGLIPKAYIPSEPRRLEAYRRLASATDFAHLDQLHKDLVDAYGQPPRPAQRLFEFAQIRVALAKLAVRTCTIREKDIIFFAKDPRPVATQMNSTANTAAAQLAPIRVLPPKDDSGLHEVYFRPPEAYFEPDTLTAVLRRRLGVPGAVDPSPTPPPAAAKPTRKVKFDL